MMDRRKRTGCRGSREWPVFASERNLCTRRERILEWAFIRHKANENAIGEEGICVSTRRVQGTRESCVNDEAGGGAREARGNEQRA